MGTLPGVVEVRRRPSADAGVLRPLRRTGSDRREPLELTKGDIDVLADERRYRRTTPLQDPDGRLAVTVGGRALDDADRERRRMQSVSHGVTAVIAARPSVRSGRGT